MQNDPNKVLEMLLRRAEGGGSPPSAQPHLDADAVAAFAAGALPQSLRNDHISHLADCSRCRVMLSAAMTFEPAGAPAPVPARLVADMPWWKTVFRAPAYTYASLLLILVFGGMIGVALLRSGDRSVEVTRVDEEIPSQSAVAPVPTQPTATAESGSQSDSETQKDPASKTEKSAVLTDRFPAITKEISSAPPAAVLAPAAREAARDEATVEQRSSAKMVAPPAPTAVRVEAELSVRNKRFIKRDGLWVDSEYRGGRVTTVERGSAEFEKLDPALRAVANEVSGPVLIVWKGDSYRIQ